MRCMIKREIEKMTAQLIKTLITNLPRYAEEEGDFYAVKREDLINALCSEQVNQAVAENTVAVCENLLDTLAVLNTDFLQQGEWCFISFPAQLLALSVLTAMSDKESRLFVNNFWNTQGISDDKKNKQRDLMHTIETNRVEYHTSGNAPPIRYIYVAWSIIKLNNQVLFYQREDTHKRFDKTAGDYGLIGGRLNQRDIANCSSNEKYHLPIVQSSHATVKDSLPDTLKRELNEEAGLIFETHYNFTLWRSLKPYRQIQGAAPNHAYTEYYVNVFHIELNLAGYIHLQSKIKSDDRLVWFSLDELEKGETAEGKIAYIKVLFNDFNKDGTALKKALMGLQNSFISEYQFKHGKYGLTLLQNTDKPLYAGVLGKEKVLNVFLMPRQSAILLGLAAHNRGFEFAALINGVLLHSDGWIEVHDVVLQRELMALAAVFEATDFVIENQQDRFFRLSVEPALLFFDERLFAFSVQQADLDSRKSKIPVAISTAAMETAIGMTVSKTEGFVITRRLACDLYKLYQHSFSDDEAFACEDNYKKAKADGFSVVGLKSLLSRREVGKIRFCTKFDVL
ncbi:NUDIX hydrolase [Crenothrix sp. D3]|nr:NUDIX hydrolase [Crenothrix sp. D3]